MTPNKVVVNGDVFKLGGVAIRPHHLLIPADKESSRGNVNLCFFFPLWFNHSCFNVETVSKLMFEKNILAIELQIVSFVSNLFLCVAAGEDIISVACGEDTGLVQFLVLFYFIIIIFYFQEVKSVLLPTVRIA